jgi:homoserine kinase
MNVNKLDSHLRRGGTSHASASGRAFCSVANLGAGFDVFGLAVNRYFDTVSARLTSSNKIRIITRGPQSNGVPSELTRNSAGPPAISLLKKADRKGGVEITVTKNVPQGLGLGSSGATAAACTKTLDHLLRLDLSNDELVQVASLGERAAAGTAHADNVAASLLGGFVIVYDEPLRTIPLKAPASLRVVIATPELVVRGNKTRKARKLVPRKIETRRAVLNVGRASAIATGFARGDIPMIGTGMNDMIAEPYRQSLIPGYDNVKKMALKTGAVGVSISGAGPSLVALVEGRKHDPRLIGQAMAKGFAQNRVRSKWFVARPAPAAEIIRGR